MDSTGRMLAQDRKSRMKVYGDLVLAKSIADVPDTALGVMLFYDITRQPTFEQVQQFAQQMQARVLQNSQLWPLRALIGTHRDQSDNRSVSYEDAVQLRNQLDMIWFEIAVGRTKTNVQTLKTQIDIRMVYAIRELIEQQRDFPSVPLSRMQTPAAPANEIAELLDES